MVEHIPFSAELGDGAVIIPVARVAVVVVNDYTAILIRTERRLAGGVAKATGPVVAAVVGKDKIVEAVALGHVSTFVKMMFLFGKDVVLECVFSFLEITEKPHLLLITNDISARVLAEKKISESMCQLEKKELAKTRFLAQ